MTPVLDAASVTVRAGGKPLVDDVTLSFAQGEKIALVGPNGAGKTTLLRLLAGELRPFAGTVRLHGRPVDSYVPRALADRRAVLSQTTAVAFAFTVADVVRMGAGDRRGPRIAALVDDALAEVDLTALGDRVIATLSGGEQQRAHFARALVQLACGEAVNGPGVLLLDEPIASLDLRHQVDFLAAVNRRAAQHTTVIAILHDLNWAARFADRIVVLDRGRIAADGPPRETITSAILERVFRVNLNPNQLTPDGIPLVVPHGMTPA